MTPPKYLFFQLQYPPKTLNLYQFQLPGYNEYLLIITMALVRVKILVWLLGQVVSFKIKLLNQTTKLTALPLPNNHYRILVTVNDKVIHNSSLGLNQGYYCYPPCPVSNIVSNGAGMTLKLFLQLNQLLPQSLRNRIIIIALEYPLTY
jgi:hypothetical protein